MRLTTTFVFATLLAAGSSSVFGFQAEFFQFDGWDHDLITSVGQTFENVTGDVDVTVTSFGVFERDTHYVVPTTHDGGGWIDTGGHPSTTGSHSLRFTFSEPLDLVVKSNTVDPDEQLIVIGGDIREYEQISGMPATAINSGPNGLAVVGGGFGLDAMTGAALGETLAVNASSIIVTHSAQAPNKFERIMVGGIVTVPEPNSIALLLIGLGSIAGRLRRRSSK